MTSKRRIIAGVPRASEIEIVIITDSKKSVVSGNKAQRPEGNRTAEPAGRVSIWAYYISNKHL